jgi:hypothetical protein
MPPAALGIPELLGARGYTLERWASEHLGIAGKTAIPSGR